jgi:hypothetical protein
MAAPVTTATQWQWPAEVLAFAADQQVQPYLEPILAAIRQLFPTAVSVEVSVVADPEIRDERHIVFDVKVPGRDVPNFVEAVRQWHHESFRRCPAPLVCTFRLCLQPVAS